MPARITAVLRRLRRDDSGQDLIEYALLVGLISCTVVSPWESCAWAGRDMVDTVNATPTAATRRASGHLGNIPVSCGGV